MTTSSGTPGAFPPPPQAQPFPSHQGQAPVPPGTNTVAILAMVFAFVFSPVGIVLGFVGRAQTKRTGQKGRTLATVAVILGFVFLALSVLAIVLVGVRGAKMVDRDSVESQISQQFAANGLGTPDSVTCPGDLKAEVGETMTCTVRGETNVEVGLRVTSVSGNTALFDIEPK
ncbi:DUF4333 domain-containing protein [Rhodococcus sp. X156]|uniref:DUF4333 domain-containing protein n=1 Tax=Rhodococcus sp. X156 TaxID=2499145 RepID=UPI000FDB2948|nr:DUF4333 domain-containing protein [Rhodococcus sp. X156]